MYYFGLRKSSRKKRKSRSKSRSKKVSFVTSSGQHVSFTPKRKRRGPIPPHLRASANRMKQLGVRYRRGDFGQMKWKSVVKKHMSKKHMSKKRSFGKRKRSKSKRRRSSKRKR